MRALKLQRERELSGCSPVPNTPMGFDTRTPPGRASAQAWPLQRGALPPLLKSRGVLVPGAQLWVLRTGAPRTSAWASPGLTGCG